MEKIVDTSEMVENQYSTRMDDMKDIARQALSDLKKPTCTCFTDWESCQVHPKKEEPEEITQEDESKVYSHVRGTDAATKKNWVESASDKPTPKEPESGRCNCTCWTCRYGEKGDYPCKCPIHGKPTPKEPESCEHRDNGLCYDCGPCDCFDTPSSEGKEKL